MKKCPCCKKNEYIDDAWGGYCKNCKFYPTWTPYDKEELKEMIKTFKKNKIK